MLFESASPVACPGGSYRVCEGRNHGEDVVELIESGDIPKLDAVTWGKYEDSHGAKLDRSVGFRDAVSFGAEETVVLGAAAGPTGGGTTEGGKSETEEVRHPVALLPRGDTGEYESVANPRADGNVEAEVKDNGESKAEDWADNAG